MKESFLLNLSGNEIDALTVLEEALTGSRFPFNKTQAKHEKN